VFGCGALELVLSIGLATLCVACARSTVTERRSPSVDGYYSIAPGSEFSTLGPFRFGGLSGAALDPDSGEVLAVSDDRMEPRIFRLRVRDETLLSVEPVGVIALRGTPVQLDPEGLALLPNGGLLVSSEGVQNREPRSPPGLFEYTRDGVFVRALDVRGRFLPPAMGPITRGVRENASFESLAVSRDGSRVFTAIETALVQDGEPASFDRGARVRLLEYERKGDTFAPGREWLYDVDATARPPFNAGIMPNGVVELAVTEDSTLLVLERSFVENLDDRAKSINRIRLYRVAFDGATDVSGADTIAGVPDLRSVSKQLVLDLDTTPGMPPGFAALDNFEALLFGAPRPGGGRPLFIISDDNFSNTQRTWFLRLRY
jgi:hypothetical protein